MADGSVEQVLLFRAGSRGCALPLSQVVETMRPLPLESLPGLPPFVKGIAIIRGEAVPVVDLGRLLSGHGGAAVTRLVTLKLEERRAAVGVESVAGVARLDGSRLQELPPLLKNSADEAIGSLGALDGRLLFVLKAGRIVPDEVWDILARTPRAP